MKGIKKKKYTLESKSYSKLIRRFVVKAFFLSTFLLSFESHSDIAFSRSTISPLTTEMQLTAHSVLLKRISPSFTATYSGQSFEYPEISSPFVLCTSPSTIYLKIWHDLVQALILEVKCQILSVCSIFCLSSCHVPLWYKARKLSKIITQIHVLRKFHKFTKNLLPSWGPFRA